jgi:NADH-quinone oxidoreductase subunit B
MARPVRFNIKKKETGDWGINMADMPEGHMGEGFFATSLDKVVGLARKNSL